MLSIEQFSRMRPCVDVNELRELAQSAFNPAVDRNREAGSSSTKRRTTAGLFTLMSFGSNEQRSAGLTTRISAGNGAAVDRESGCLLCEKARFATYPGPGSTAGQAVKRLGCGLKQPRGDTSPDGTGSAVQAPLCRDDIS